MNYIIDFLAGMLLCNSLPHLVCGLIGEPFPTPFAKPHGVGDSSPLLNFLWGSGNLFAGGYLAAGQLGGEHQAGQAWVMAAGFLCLGIFASVHFGRVRAARKKA